MAVYDTLGIMECIKNRYPVLMLDRFEINDNADHAVGMKNFSCNEYYWNGHFPDEAVCPGIFLLEAMLESFILIFLTKEEYKGMETADSLINNLKFRKKVRPGDTLYCNAELHYFRRGVARGKVIGYVNGEEVCSCEPEVVIPQMLLTLTPRT